MPDFLAFTLAAPMASFGEVAGNENRSTREQPGHSLIVGLLGAALGLPRDDARLITLSENLSVAVAMETRGHPLRDFHTAQSAPTRRGRRPATAREALVLMNEKEDLNTIISRRDYLTDVVVSVVVAAHEAPFALEEMVHCLRRPRFTLFLGRKSCPLALPVDARVIVADTAEEALAQQRTRSREMAKTYFPVELAGGPMTMAPELATPGRAHVARTRRARTGSRATWSYRLLQELVLTNPPAAPKTGESS